MRGVNTRADMRRLAIVRGLVAIAAVALLVGHVLGQFAPDDPKTPEEIVNYFVYAEVRQDGKHDDVKDRLREKAESSAVLIAAHLRLPAKLDEWEMDVEQPVGQPLSRAVMAVFNHRLLQELGREHADPILKEFFEANRKLLEEAREQLQQGVEGKNAEEFARLVRAEEFFSGLMTRAIRIAVELRTPVLVEPVLKFYEAGLEHRYTHWADYALIHAPQREDVIPRLRAVVRDPETPELMRHEIGRALERYLASLG